MYNICRASCLAFRALRVRTDDNPCVCVRSSRSIVPSHPLPASPTSLTCLRSSLRSLRRAHFDKNWGIDVIVSFKQGALKGGHHVMFSFDGKHAVVIETSPDGTIIAGARAANTRPREARTRQCSHLPPRVCRRLVRCVTGCACSSV